jgi:hypothetical protein
MTFIKLKKLSAGFGHSEYITSAPHSLICWWPWIGRTGRARSQSNVEGVPVCDGIFPHDFDREYTVLNLRNHHKDVDLVIGVGRRVVNERASYIIPWCEGLLVFFTNLLADLWRVEMWHENVTLEHHNRRPQRNIDLLIFLSATVNCLNWHVWVDVYALTILGIECLEAIRARRAV